MRSDLARAIESSASRVERRTNCARSEVISALHLEVVQYQHCVPPILTEALQNFHFDYDEGSGKRREVLKSDL